MRDRRTKNRVSLVEYINFTFNALKCNSQTWKENVDRYVTPNPVKLMKKITNYVTARKSSTI